MVNHGKHIDRYLGVLGILLSVTMFLAQGPYDHAWQYALAGTPFVLAVLAIAVMRFGRYLRHLQESLFYAQNALALVTATRVMTTLTAQLLNTHGDVSYKRTYRIELTKDGVMLSLTKRELLYTSTHESGIPPPARLIASSNTLQTLTPTRIEHEEVDLGGRGHWKYAWSYRLEPALALAGAFVEYEYALNILKSEADAFTDKGGLFAVEPGTVNMSLEATLIGLSEHTLVLEEVWEEDGRGHKVPVSEDEQPTLDGSKRVLTWKPGYRRDGRLICRYRQVHD